MIATLEVAAIAGLLFLCAGWPTPEINEAHYLCKAKHFWQPDWCPADHFLASADAHWVFYWTLGWLTLLMPLPAVAWVGRWIGWGLLAWSWRRFSISLFPKPFLAVLSAGAFFALTLQFHMAGEWIVGGIEAKTFAFVFVFLGLEALVKGHWNRVWLMFGAASAFHVLVGGWSVVAAVFCWTIESAIALARKKTRPPLLKMLPGLVGGGALSLFGLVPAALLSGAADARIATQAARIYVYERLPHHLVFHTFERPLIIRHVLLLIVWIALSAFVRTENGGRRWRNYVWGAVFIGVLGVVIDLATLNNPEVGAKLLRFYWFRLSDIMLPAGVAMASIALAYQVTKDQRVDLAVFLATISVLTAVGLALHIHARYHQWVGDPEFADDHFKYDDWRATCDWIRENTAPDAVFLTPMRQQTFKWYAHRAEVFNRKDIPQDAPGVIEWRQRYHDIFDTGDPDPELRWRATIAENTAEEIAALQEKYDFQYVVLDRKRLRFGKIRHRENLYQVYPQFPTVNDSYRVYRYGNSATAKPDPKMLRQQGRREAAQ
jgi:hypothetical protein